VKVEVTVGFVTVALTTTFASGAYDSMQIARPGSWLVHATDHFDIYHLPVHRENVQTVAREAERAYARVSFDLKHDLAEKLPLIVVATDRDLPQDREQARAIVIASGAPERDHLLLSIETLEKRRHVVSHELTHQFVFELLPEADRVASWLTEGLCDHEGKMWDSADAARVRDAIARNSIPAIARLTASDRHWGHAMFDFIAAEYGAEGIRRYLAALRASSTAAADAVQAAFGVPTIDFDRRFQQYVKVTW
jgi:hypothetical protein